MTDVSRTVCCRLSAPVSTLRAAKLLFDIMLLKKLEGALPPYHQTFESLVLPKKVGQERMRDLVRARAVLGVAVYFLLWANVIGWQLSPRESHTKVDRRSVLHNIMGGLVGSALLMPTNVLPSFAADDDVFVKQGKGFSYSFVPPPGFSQSKKPLQTHLDEVNFVSEAIKGYQIGITVDPVRIESLKQFGSPEEVAAQVVTAEVNRDGVFEVTLKSDPVVADDGAYILEYLSDGKRGKKIFVTKIAIQNKMLYVLTAQSKQEDYESVKGQIAQAATSFHVNL